MTNQIINKRLQQYGKLAVITIAAVYLLILVGGIVRSSGSGMGCPDWPKCFGNWIPPTSASQLPPDYKEVYSQKRDQKNKRFANMLDLLGAGELAQQLREDKTILQEADFNPQKTWIEYVNRLVGVTIGLLIIGTFLLSFKLRKVKPGIFWASLATLVLVIFQGWLGSIVVSTNLLPWMVTVHMLPALIIIALLIWAAYEAGGETMGVLRIASAGKLNALMFILIGLSVLQIVLGTQVREMVDEVAVANNYLERDKWISELGMTFYIHRSFSLIILGFHLLLFYIVRKFGQPGSALNKWTTLLMVVVGVEILSGIILAYFAIPAFVQPMHLLFGTVLFGIQFYLILLVNSSVKENINLNNSKACLLQEVGK